jgi:hypothetical protein
MGFQKPETPESLTYTFIVENAEYSLESQSKNWKVWVWKEIVLLKLSGIWNPGLYPYHFSDFWDTFAERKHYWHRIYFVVNANDMPVQSDEFHQYVRRNWQHLVERKDFCLCVVENKQTATIPEKLTLGWLKDHAQIQFGGDELRWALLAWQNIIFIQISNEWKPEELDSHADNLSGLPDMLPKLSKRWDKIFLVFDMSRMKSKREDASRYLRSNWLDFLNREDMKVCIVEGNRIRRALLRSLYIIIGRLGSIKLFPGCDQAFGWVRGEIRSDRSIARR